MRREVLDQRVLGALRFVDAATQLPVGSPLAVEADGVGLIRNASGLYVVVRAPDFEAYTAAVDPPLPAVGTRPVVFTIRDPSRRYLARRKIVEFPRTATAVGEAIPPLFVPVDVKMYHAPAAAAAPGWALVRLSVKDQAGNALAGALVVVERKGGAELARGLSDARGEALVAVPGIAVTNWNAAADDPVTTVVVAAKVTAFYAPPANPPVPPNPDTIRTAAGVKSASFEADLSSGKLEKRAVEITLG
ncbi:MAG TPA: hypothetical protein VMZ71_06285 [Gemmataceae bacterium]|nr:hypothetical protein [Gemmataceae bacterium]